MKSLISKCATLAAAVALASLCPVAVQAQWITGYVQGQSGVGGFESPNNIPWSKYTHIIQYAANPGANGTIIDGSLSPSENRAIVANAHAAGKKVLFSMYDNGNGGAMVTNTNSTNLSTFVTNLISYMNTYGYDGIDFDWESSINVTQYENLIAALRARIGAGKLIAIAVYPQEPMQTAANQAANLDQINVMSYDNDLFASDTWHNSAVLQRTSGNADSQQGFVNAAIATGIPKSKIGVGVPFYGRHYSGANAPGQLKGTNRGTVYYRDVSINASIFNSTTLKWDATYQADYLSLPGTDEFYTINGTRSMAATAAFVKAQGLGGVMVFEIDHEWIQSASGDARYPLSSALYTAVFGGTPPPSNTPPSITTTSPLPAGTVGTPYSLQVNATGTTPMTWTVTSGGPPGGMALNSGGTISGTPTASGTSSFTIEAANASGNSVRQFNLTVNPKSTTPSTWFNLVSKNSGKCLDVTGESTAENVQLQQWACWGGDNQKFQFTPVTGGYKITAKNSGLQVNVRGGTSATQNGAAIIQWPYGGASNEIWNTHPNADGSYSITVLNSGKCMDVTGWSTNNGALIQQWSCTGGANQKWSLVPVQ